ncbi:MAG TPA: AsmA family protein, partial [Azonexus sp.]|nr:AsmA family protein [Azonexus sp.]
ELVIGGDLQLSLGWPLLHVRASDVKFGNPSWASQKHMLTADDVDFSLALPTALFERRLALDIVALRQANIFLEANAAGQKNWLLDLEQKNEEARLHIGRLALEKSRLNYEEAAQKTSLVADISTRDDKAEGDVVLNARGQYRGQPFMARGSGGPVLALRDERRPYPFEIEAKIGRTSVQAKGSVTGFSKLRALDARVVLRGDSLAQLFPLLGIALPETPAYRTTGRITHSAGMWRYQNFSARIGNSDCSGTLQVDSAGRRTGPRPFLHGELFCGKLDWVDLGPVIGSRNGEKPSAAAAGEAAAEYRRLLPAMPFRTERWDSVDADIKLSAGTIIHPRQLPIEKLFTHLRLRDSVLSLEPLNFGVAGGTLGGTVKLDGQRNPIQAQTRLAAKGIVFERLFPTVKLKSASFGHVTAQIEIAGSGNSVATMLGTANGNVGLVVAGGEVSKLAMEMAGLHVLEIVVLKIAGDKPTPMRCGMAGFDVQNGVMQAEQLIFDTAISNVSGSGSIDFRQEKLDLTLMPKSKKPSLIALRSPIYLRGTFARPEVDVDTGRIAVRSLGALALGLANPLLALAPLVEAGPGMDSDCGRLIAEAQQPAANKAGR